MTETTSPTPSPPLTASQRQWLDHLETWQEQDVTLKAYALTHGLSVSGLYTAKRLFKRRGIWRGREGNRSSRSRAELVRVRVTPARATPTMFRVHLPNGIVVEVPEDVEPARCRALPGHSP